MSSVKHDFEALQSIPSRHAHLFDELNINNEASVNSLSGSYPIDKDIKEDPYYESKRELEQSIANCNKFMYQLIPHHLHCYNNLRQNQQSYNNNYNRNTNHNTDTPPVVVGSAPLELTRTVTEIGEFISSLKKEMDACNEELSLLDSMLVVLERSGGLIPNRLVSRSQPQLKPLLSSSLSATHDNGSNTAHSIIVPREGQSIDVLSNSLSSWQPSLPRPSGVKEGIEGSESFREDTLEDRQSFTNQCHCTYKRDILPFYNIMKDVEKMLLSRRPIKSMVLLLRQAFVKDPHGGLMIDIGGESGVLRYLTNKYELYHVQIVAAAGEGDSSSSNKYDDNEGFGFIGRRAPGGHPSTVVADEKRDSDNRHIHESNSAFLETQKDIIDCELEAQDEVLDRLADGVTRLKEVSINIKEEIKVQDRILQEASSMIDRVSGGLSAVDKKVTVLLQKMSNKGKIILIIALMSVLIFLIFFLF